MKTKKKSIPSLFRLLIKDNLTIDVPFTITVTNKFDASTIETISSPPSTINFGEEFPSLDFNIFSKDPDTGKTTLLNGEAEFSLCVLPDSIHCQNSVAVPTVEGLTLSPVFTPDQHGEWALSVHWLGNDDFDEETHGIPFPVNQSGSVLDLFFLELPQVFGQPRRIPGRLRIENGNPGGVDLSGREIIVEIFSPKGGGRGGRRAQKI